jgi:hypothetical protein
MAAAVEGVSLELASGQRYERILVLLGKINIFFLPSRSIYRARMDDELI